MEVPHGEGLAAPPDLQCYGMLGGLKAKVNRYGAMLMLDEWVSSSKCTRICPWNLNVQT
jgi:hypothetical protein